MNNGKIFMLRVAHGLFAAYFLVCLCYLYYAVVTNQFNYLLLISVVSLAIEGFVVFILNKGDCPLIHIQRKIGDDKPFFELFFRPAIAKQAIPVFSAITWVAVALLIVRLVTR